MTNAEFRDLCRATCLALNLQDTSMLGEQGQIEIDDVSIGAFFDEDSDTTINCYVDLGAVDANDKAEMFEQMLELNLELGRQHGETLGFDRDTGRMVLRSELSDPEQWDGEQMAALFHDYANFAKEFRAQMHEGSQYEDEHPAQDELV
ncbi:CesT family type III secretion system chaperone [Lacisediminimonas sp.]|uniref:CesT family type III secretion system chaperone n=1 Tax=Lacisediminimonas sp. TaxID=3060582 RepID=UPI00271B567C|nr:CesT family type III secretion system chaperone [Lacisediminimonas sp.]MDO8300310.1 CesT family type III secretion system chaperone [Lacisediminimonas sp.]